MNAPFSKKAKTLFSSGNSEDRKSALGISKGTKRIQLSNGSTVTLRSGSSISSYRSVGIRPKKR